MELPIDAKKIRVKWVYKTMLNVLGEIDKYRAWLVVKCYTRDYGINYTKIFKPLSRMDTIRMIIAFTVQRDRKLYQLDIKSTLL